MGECAKIGRGCTAMYGSVRTGRDQNMSRRLCAILGCWEKASPNDPSKGIKKASRRCFVEANNQWELPCV
uniref:Uncharacterized protein n=1 Tax=Brassica campestris TaxID=3711 RepID=M4FJ24_BRACM